MISRRFADFLSRLRQGMKNSDRDRLAAVLELNRALVDVNDFKEVAVRLIDEAIQLFGAERGFLILTSEDPVGFQIEVARSLDRESVRTPRQKVSATVVTQCLENAEGIFCEDAREGDFGAAQSVADLQLRSVLCMPLVVAGEVLGCVYLDHRFQAGVFQEVDLPWFQAFADQGAIVVHFHRMLERDRNRADSIARRNQDLEARVESQEVTLSKLQPVSRDQLSHQYPEILGESASIMHMLDLLDRVTASSFPVLLLGESGTGKELAARALYQNGPASSGEFVAVNVAAISKGLMESELFGHLRGSFTGADRDRQGLLQRADGGVLFLDEVTEMDLETQVKLLRFLENSTVRPIGADHEVTVSLRVIAATNRDPLEAIELGTFRRDLYYRLAVVTVELPPLRQCRADIRGLIQAFFDDVALERGGPPVEPTDELIQAMLRRSWPGNVRQLRNEVLRLDALAENGAVQLRHLSAEPTQTTAQELNLLRLERWAIQQALIATDGNKSEAARVLGISRRALYHKLPKDS